MMYVNIKIKMANVYIFQHIYIYIIDRQLRQKYYLLLFINIF